MESCRYSQICSRVTAQATYWRDVEGRPVRWNSSTKAWGLVEIAPEEISDIEETSARDRVSELSRIVSGEKSGDRFKSNLAKRSKDVIEAYEKLSDDQLDSISLYTTEEFTYINNHLRGKKSEDLSPEQQEFYAKKANDLTEALRRIPNAKSQTYYRGTAGDIETSAAQKKFAKLKPGDTFQDKSFGSYSTSSDAAQEFIDREVSSTYFILKSSSLKQVDVLSSSPQEEEHLSMPGQKFLVKSNNMVDDRSMGRVRVIELEDAV
jgi:NAD:arginine ADP-ribosyltransferase.